MIPMTPHTQGRFSMNKGPALLIFGLLAALLMQSAKETEDPSEAAEGLSALGQERSYPGA